MQQPALTTLSLWTICCCCCFLFGFVGLVKSIDLCAPDGIMQMTDQSTPRHCLTDSDCLPPAKCQQEHKICCFLPLGQEAPPVGCPKGTRQLRNSKGEWLSCTPTRPGSCPGGALCYEDSLEPQQFRCCGKDPAEGCGTGQRVLRNENGSSRLCVPGDGSECPGNAICEWSFAIDRFQCCEPDNGCQNTETPMFDSKDEVLSCSPAQPHPCPDAAACRFNFWTASYQCCAPLNPPTSPILTSKTREIQQKGGISEVGQPAPKECPAGEIPYPMEPFGLESPGNQCNSDVDCPPMAHCHTGSRLCCGPPGDCPRPGEHPIFDELGHVRLCSLVEPELCPSDAKCRETVDPFSGLSTGQRVCCGAFNFECAASGQPFPSEENPLRCELDNPITCPMDMLCQASNVPGVSICCRAAADRRAGSSRRNLCPHGWNPYGLLNIFCHPTLHGSCPGRSACILSPSSGQFICCIPIGTEAEEERRHRAQLDATGTGRRLRGSAALSCPNPDDHVDTTPGGYPRQCTTDHRIPCRRGFLCEPSAEDPRLGVCCSEWRSALSGLVKKRPDFGRHSRDPSAVYRCPTAAQVPVVRQGQNVFCDMPGQQCPTGSSCQSALNSFAMMICCRHARSNQPVCPEGMRPQESSPIGYVLCDMQQPNDCAEGFQCVRSRDDPEQSLCCARLRNARPATQYICPNQQSPYRDGSGPRFCPPNAVSTTSVCPRGYSCEEALGQPGVFLCCSIPAQPVCPAGFDASLDLRSGNPIYCSPSDLSMCPADANCLPAENRANTFLCCVSREPGRICPQPNQHALLQPNGQPEQCSGPGAPCSKPSYTCQLSYTLNNRYVCCGPPGAVILCADGRETYQQELGKTVHCNPISLYSECPAGFECALSNVPNTHVCCRRLEAPQPTPQAPTDLPQLPLPAGPSATFRPPVEDLSCPIGWSAFEDQKGAHHFCQDALDMTCPPGFSCAQSSVNGIFMCCRLASAIQCPSAYTTLMLNNNPRLCSIGQRQIGGQTASGGYGSTSRYGTATQQFNACPTGYSCMQSSVPAVYVCCGSNTLPLPSSTGSVSGGTDQLYCSDGQIPAYIGQYVRYCSAVGQATECPPSYVCGPSNRAGIYVCCHPFPVRRRAATNPSWPLLDAQQQQSIAHCGQGGRVALEPSRHEPMECRGEENSGDSSRNAPAECPEGFHCQPSLANTKMYCCGNTTKTKAQAVDLFSPIPPTAQLCPDGHAAYKSPGIGGLLLCGPNSMNGPSCPAGFECRQSPWLEGTRICCSTQKAQILDGN